MPPFSVGRTVVAVRPIRDLRKPVASAWEKQVLSARGVQARRKVLRIRHIHGMEVRKKRPRGFKKEARGFT
jgi:hypothetical protein